MGYFEDHLSRLGRALDGATDLVRERTAAVSGRLVDRRAHARSFDAIRDRVGRAGEAARTGTERSIASAREHWWRRNPADRENARGLAVWLGVLACLLLVSAALRTWITPRAATLTEQEAATIRRVQALSQGVADRPQIGMDGWTRRHSP